MSLRSGLPASPQTLMDQRMLAAQRAEGVSLPLSTAGYIRQQCLGLGMRADEDDLRDIKPGSIIRMTVI